MTTMAMTATRSWSQRRRIQLLLVYILTVWKCSNALVSPSIFTNTPKRTTTSSFVELIEPETNCRVILLGCLHGSQSSAKDVQDLFEQGVDTVVLELCASRVADLRRRQQAKLVESSQTAQPRQFSLSNYMKMVARTSEKRGFASGAAAAVLGGASGLQTALSGFEAGLEFTTALELAKQTKCDVVLADQAVDETLTRVGSLPSTSLSMMFQEGKLPYEESNALKTAVFGDDALRPFQVNMGQVLTRNTAVVQELLKLTLPSMSLAILAGTVVDNSFNKMFSHTVQHTDISWFTLLQDFSLMELWNNVAMDIVSSILVLLLGYVALALPATRVILCERDDQLTDGIRAACRSASSKNENARVVAVLGLLHVNGVAKRLLQKRQDGDKEDAVVEK